jgi:predicted Zn-dependent protease
MLFNCSLVISIFLLLSYDLPAQNARTYKVCDIYTKNSDSIKAVIKRLEKDELNELTPGQRKFLSPVLTKTTKGLNDQIDEEVIISDRELQQMLEETYLLLDSSYHPIKSVKQILISNDPLVNAVSYSQGTIVINIGLLGIINNQSQLAFIMAHELAHYELRHVFRKNTANAGSANTAMQELKKLKSGGGSSQGYNSILSWLDGYSSVSQQLELEADSLALAMLSKSAFDLL